MKTRIKEIRSLTALRGIAAVIVVIHHYASNKKNLLDSHGLEYFVRKLLLKGYLSVDLFFILSSFVLLLTYTKSFYDGITAKGYKDYMIKRFARIYPVYFICMLLYVAVKQQYSAADIAINGLFLQSIFTADHFIIGPGWSLSTEWFMYLLFPVLIVLFNNRKLFWVTCLSLVFLVGATMLPNAHINTTKLVYSKDLWDFEMKYLSGTNAIFKTLGNYLLGFVVYRLYINRSINISSFPFLAMLVVSILLSILFINDIVTILLLATLILSLSQAEQAEKIKVPRIFYFFGEISYSLYLLHMLPIIFFEHYDFHLGKIMVKGVSFAITIFLSYFSFKYLEIPLKDFVLKKINKPSPHAKPL